MKTLGYYNGTIDELDRICVPMLDRACYFGDGVYDVTFSRNHKIYMVEEHVARFFQSAARIGIRPELTENELCELLKTLILRLDDGEQWVYFQFSRGTDFRAHAFPQNAKANLWIMFKPAKIKDTYRTLRCISLEDSRSLYCHIKSLNLLPNVLLTQATVEAGVDECILHRNGIVTECAHSNVSILKNGTLITHPADCHILAGTGRAHLINTCKSFGMEVVEREYTLDELRSADEIILTSASALCMQIIELDGTPIGMRDTATLRKLQDALLKDFLEKTE